MFCFQVRKMQAVAMAAAATFCVAASETLVAASQTTAPDVIYTATGVFSSQLISGNDQFHLAGEPFSISIYVSSTAVPTNQGSAFAEYTNLKMAGTITSSVFGPQSLFCPFANIALENGSLEVFTVLSRISVIGIPINVQASIHLRPGTMGLAPIRPFAPVALGSPDTVTYSCPSDSTSCTPGESTVLAIASGTIGGAFPSAGGDTAEAQASVQLHAGGAQVITTHGDGTKLVRSMGAAPVDLGASSDVVVLQFYASGVRPGAEIHMQIAGQDARVLYAGPANYFPGLDEVRIGVPRSLAGSGNADVALTVDGRTASPVHIEIQ